MINENTITKIFNEIFELKSTESVLILVDESYFEMGLQFMVIAKNITSNVLLEKLTGITQNGMEPNNHICQLMNSYDVQIYLTTYSLSHTNARRNASTNGARIISCPGITIDMFNRCIDINYKDLVSFHEKLRPIILNSKKIEIKTTKGTNITLSVHDTEGEASKIILNKKGSFSNLPTGEVDSGITRHLTNGRIVFDGSFPKILLQNPITMDVTNGIAKIISNNKESIQLKEMLDIVGDGAYKLAELGIGTNPLAKLTGILLEDEKVKGTVHIALGNDVSYNGDNNVPIHLDGVIREPTLIVDGVKIMDCGKFIL